MKTDRQLQTEFPARRLSVKLLDLAAPDRMPNSLGGFLMNTKTVIILIVAVLLLIIIVQNTQVVTLRLFFWKISMSRIIFLVLTLIVGFALGYVVAGIGTGKPKNG